MQRVTGASRQTAGEGRSDDREGNCGDGNDGQVAEKRLRCGAGSAETSVDQSNARNRQRG
jgi:hypothetical protein